jgi:DNA invertase Pin-like site-specific DNA recombinase
MASARFTDPIEPMLTVLGGLAEFERTLIKARTGEGRERAKGRGVRFGRPLKLSAHQRREAIERLDAGDAVVDVARTFGVDRATCIGCERMRPSKAIEAGGRVSV